MHPSVLKAVDVVEDPAEWDQDQQKGWQKHTLANLIMGCRALATWASGTLSMFNDFLYYSISTKNKYETYENIWNLLVCSILFCKQASIIGRLLFLPWLNQGVLCCTLITWGPKAEQKRMLRSKSFTQRLQVKNDLRNRFIAKIRSGTTPAQGGKCSKIDKKITDWIRTPNLVVLRLIHSNLTRRTADFQVLSCVSSINTRPEKQANQVFDNLN